MVISGNLYAPNEEDSDFFFNLKKILLDFGDFPFILGGDFNQPLDTFLVQIWDNQAFQNRECNQIFLQT